MIDRREFLGITAGAGAALTLRPELRGAFPQSSGLRAHAQLEGGKLIQRAIPSSGEMLPVIGLQFGNPPPPDPPRSRRSSRRCSTTAANSLDTVHQAAAAEEVTATTATELGMQDKLFWSSRASPAGPPPPGPSDAVAKAQLERSLREVQGSQARSGR